jgi:glycosyltransferase involved in cell wall biosynthesis
MVKNVFVVMPAYNAGKTIEKVFARLPHSAKHRIKRYVVVNDGSTDDTEETLARLQLSYPDLVILRHETNRGYGAAEKTLLNYALQEGADVSVLLHSDGQYSPEKIPDLMRPFDLHEADIVQGSRILGKGALRGGMPLYKFVANKCLTAIENLAFGMKMAEYHSGYMLYSRKVLLEIPFNKLSDSFEFDLEMIVMAKIMGLRIVEVPIPTIYADEISHLKPVQYGFDVLSVVLRYLRGKYHSLYDGIR